MTYEKFSQKEDIKREKLKHEAWIRANKAYNKGLLNELGFFHAYLYPHFKRPTGV